MRETHIYILIWCSCLCFSLHDPPPAVHITATLSCLTALEDLENITIEFTANGKTFLKRIGFVAKGEDVNVAYKDVRLKPGINVWSSRVVNVIRNPSTVIFWGKGEIEVEIDSIGESITVKLMGYEYNFSFHLNNIHK